MKLIRILLLLLCILGLNCSLSTVVPGFSYTRVDVSNEVVRVIPIWIDKNFGEADKIEIDKAVGQWNYALNGFIKLEIVDTHFDMEIDVIKKIREVNGWIILKVDSSNPILDGLHHPERTLGWADKVGGNYIFLVRDKLANHWVVGVGMHEMGHLLGAGHVGELLMHDGFRWETCRCIDLSSLEAVAKYQHLPVKRMNYCSYHL